MQNRADAVGGIVLLQEPHVQRDKERLAKKLDAPKETFVMPEVAKYESLLCVNL